MADKAGNLIDPEDLQPIFKFIGKNWHLLIIFPLVAIAGAYLYNARQHDIYAAKAEILLKSSETYDYQKQIYSSLGYYTLLQDITNQKRVIASYDMTSKTLNTLDFQVSYLLEGRWAAKYVHEFLFLDVDVQRMEPQLMQTPFTIRIVDLDSYTLSYNLYGNDHKKLYNFGELIEDVHYDLKVDRHERFTDEKFDSQKDRIWQFLVNPPNRLVGKYRGGLSIENVDYTSILTLQVRDEVPERAKMFLDSLSRVYIDYTLESQIQVNKNTEEHIEKQLIELEEIIDSLEFELERFKASNNILDLDKEALSTSKT